jgi:hypothetical protein
MKLILINSSSDSYSYLSDAVIVPANSSLDVSSDYWFSLYSDPMFLKDIRLSNLTVNDGVENLTMPRSEEYVKYLNTSFNYNNKDIDGAMIVRMKAAKKGWSFWAVPVEITTSTISGTIHCKTSDGNDIPWVNCKIYNASNVEITTPGLLDVNLATCVKTVIDFEPTFDYEIIGGALRINSNPSQDVRLWIVGAPDIPAQFGGSKEFASGINLKFLAPDSSFEIDGRVTKYLIYNPVTHQGKMRLILKHPPGLQLNIQTVIHIYRL